MMREAGPTSGMVCSNEYLEMVGKVCVSALDRFQSEEIIPFHPT